MWMYSETYHQNVFWIVLLNRVLHLVYLRTTETFSGQISSKSQKLFSFLDIKLIEGVHCLNSCRIQKFPYKDLLYFLKNP